MSVFYPVMEHFYTLQGEGCYSGHAAYFIRLAGCDVGCTWCDVPESWPIAGHPVLDINELLSAVASSGSHIVVVTGGEPTMHDLAPITDGLTQMGVRTHIETSGTHPLSGLWDWVCLSPKRFKKPLPEYFEIANELKIIVAHTNDLRWALDLGSMVSDSCQRLIQVEWSKRDLLTPELISFVKSNPNWHLSMQTHKYLGIP